MGRMDTVTSASATSDTPKGPPDGRGVPPGIDPSYLDVAGAAGKRSAEIEELRRLPTDLIEQLIDTGVFRLWVPEKYGGIQGSVQDLIDVVELAAYHDGATGWSVMIGGTTALNAGYLRPDFAETIYGDPRALTGGLGRPAGTATMDGDGLRVSGTWSWGSGTSHCTWIGGGVRILDENGEPSRLADGSAAPFVYFERDQVELADNWHVMGLKGSGSVDYSVTDAFVPADRWVSLGVGAPVVDAPLYRFSLLGALAMGVSAVTLGLARRAVDELVELGSKRPEGSSRTLAERPSVQAELAQADADVRAARAFVTEAVGTCWDRAASGDDLGDEDKRLLRAAANHAVRRSVEAIDRCYTLGGGTAVYETNALQRIFRDAHAATQHAMTAPRMWEPLGRLLFGLPTSTNQF